MSKIFTITEGLENLGALRTGGQGSVYKGRRMGAIYSAVKLIPTPIYTEDLNDKNYLNFKNEVEKLLKVNEIPNPNVVKMLSFGITESGSFPFIEMEYIEGFDLGELLQSPHEKIFTIKEVIKVAEHLASALAHCHSVGVKHGDIKSNNIKYNIHSGNYVLLDFGLAIMSEEQRRSSMRHAGAVEFMAPEQNEGELLLQSDVYSYGIILYELLGGQVPFPLIGGSDTARNRVMIGHLEGEVPDVTQLRNANLPANWTDEQKVSEMQVPNWLLNLIATCLQKDPALRYSNGMTLHQALINLSLLTNPKIAIPQKIERENATTQTEVPKKSGIFLSTFAFSSLMIVFIGLIAYVGYTELFKNEPEQYVENPVDSAIQTSDTSELDEANSAYQRTLLRNAELRRVRDSVLKADARRSAENTADTVESTPPDTSTTEQQF
ncbi:MAG: serine/threonine protein kinase [Pedobacter sp.]|nr:serine/threonine protein kinase [Pedobacter sp.]